ncbi:MAG: transporter [Nevskia sp.]|nr:transporter [Nevskia sp.]
MRNEYPQVSATGQAPARLRLWLLYLTLGSCGCLIALLFCAVAPVLPALAEHFGGGTGGAFSAQMVMAVSTLGIIAGASPAGWLVERRGGRTVLLASLALYTLSGTAALYVDGRGALLASRFVLGLATGGLITASVVLIGQHFDAAARARFLGYANAAGAVAGVSGGVLAGVIGSVGGWRAPFALYGLGLVLLLSGLAAARVKPGPGPGAEPAASKGGSSGILALWPIYLTILCAYVVVFMTTTQVSFLLAANGTSSPAVVGLVLSGASLLAAVGAWLYGRVAARLGRGRLLALALFLLGAGCAVMGLWTQPTMTFAGCCLTGLGGGLLNVYFPVLLMDLAPLPVRARALGLLYTVQFFGDFINPFVIYPLRQSFGIEGAFVAIGGLMFAGALAAALRGGFGGSAPRQVAA